MKNLRCRLITVLALFAFSFTAIAKNPNNLNAHSGTSEASTHFGGASVNPGKIVVKVKPEFRSLCSDGGIQDSRFHSALAQLNSPVISKKFPSKTQPEQALNRQGKKTTDLSLVYQLNFSPDTDIHKAIMLMKYTGLFVYVEPLYKHQMSFIPNDPSVSTQTFLTRINAYNAWDITQGDTNVVIGIVDSGTDWDHPDLQGNIKYNWADPIDGVDNDADGFTDNFRGWDVSHNDNNPMVVSSTHGSHVSGCAAAVTNNGVGVASPGFNCKFLPVKSSLDASTSSIDDGYDGVIYAADHGAHIINCSWGRGGTPSQFEQDIIDHVTNDLDVLVIAAAGNDGQEIEHYPSSYKNVISVASTSSSDSKSSFSNYGFGIDVCAPGGNIYSTTFNNTYGNSSGTSMSAPIAAGGAGLIKSMFPGFNALQIGQQLRVTCDNIYGVSGNAAFNNKLGKGRINLFKAVTDTLSPGVIVDELYTEDGNDNVFIAGDTLRMTAVFKNLLRPTANLSCSLVSQSSFVQVISASFNAGVIGTMDTASNYSLPFVAVISPSTPTNTVVTFRIIMSDGSWSDFYAFKTTVNVDYINIDVNDVATSITSKGLIGYNESGQVQGIGFKYLGGTSMLYEMGLMIGASGTQVSDNIRADGAAYDSDFSALFKVAEQSPAVISDFDAAGTFNDNGSTSTNPLNVHVAHRAFAWTSALDRKYIMVEYTIRNNSPVTWTNMYAGLCADWDIMNYANNKCSVDNTRRMGYVWSTDAGGLYGGIKLLSGGGFSHYAIDNVSGGGGLNLSDGFSNAEKYQALSTFRADAGNTLPAGNDVINTVSSGPFTLASGDSVVVAFALIAGEDLAMIQASADAAQLMYDAIFTGIEKLGPAASNSLESCYPNPAIDFTVIEFSVVKSGMTELTVYDNLGNKVKTLVSENLNQGRYSARMNVSELPSGIYHYTLTSGDFRKTSSFSVSR
ncbi:MAG: T9SS C-terminal target domain-containing protein [Bacteroidetes bacterium]|nr:MAG: T9SS C-terminal target domain-containing protein [Bacteroidota bacterium]REK06545.1 MAG: T9SS C-terminal target domain-containing protein [Bacteroidota bacterium]REK33311.1 MAG: T9SS C-terminal target domain-containing protein [Bacteroidota bacterium]REK49711.1 MAG: T9SS C-terminal target domain-containing protein [Bacteroidota bacterium]